MLSNHSTSEPFTVAMILGILVFTAFFLHTLFRLYTLREQISFSHALNTRQQPKSRRFRYPLQSRLLHPHLNRIRNPDKLPNDDAVYTPTMAVRVHLVEDEEAVLPARDDEVEGPLPEQAATVPHPLVAPPPAYGLWRCSVRADPKLLFWLPAATPTRSSSTTLPATALSRSPPSYVTEAGNVTDVGPFDER